MSGVSSPYPETKKRLLRIYSSPALVLLIMILAFGTGCATIKRANQAQNPDITPPGQRTVTAAEAGLNAETVLTLDRAVEIASAYHPAIVQAQEALKIAESAVRDALAACLPSINVAGSVVWATRNIQPTRVQVVTVTPTGNPPVPQIGTKTQTIKTPASNQSSESYSVSGSLTQIVFDYGRTFAAVRDAEAIRQAADESLRAMQNTITYGVQLAYYQLNEAMALQKVADETVKQFELHLDQTKALVKVGKRIKYDQTVAEVNLGNAKLSLISATNSVTTARALLNQSMGLAEDPGYKITEPELVEINYTFDDLIKRAWEKQPELQALVNQEQAASAQVDGAVAGLFPAITLNANYGYSGISFPLVWNWTIAPSVVWTIFNGFHNVNLIDQAAANLRTAHAKKAAAEQQIYLNISQAMAQLTSARERMDLSDLVVKQAQDALYLANELFKVGRSTTIDVTDAEVALYKAKSGQVQARYDYLSAVALIKRTVGGF